MQILQDTSLNWIQYPMSYTLTNSMVLVNILAIYPWGDKIREGTEQWDDGNFVSSDGCSPTWQFDSGVSWDTRPDLWGTCGNGARSNSEEWDDGNSNAGDGCSDICTIEDSWDWVGGTATQKDIED